MNPTKKFWYDENSEPPKNYIWVKNNKQYKFSVSERRWKEITSDGDGDGGNGGSMSMYDAWMKAFDGFKVLQSDRTSYLNVTPALVILNDNFYSENMTNDPYIPLTFMNSQTKKYKQYSGTFEEDFIDIKNTPDDIYEKIINQYIGTPYCRFLYDLDELNEKAQNIDTGIDCLDINGSYYNGQTQLKCGNASYIPQVRDCLIKINDKYYVWFPSSID